MVFLGNGKSFLHLYLFLSHDKFDSPRVHCDCFGDYMQYTQHSSLIGSSKKHVAGLLSLLYVCDICTAAVLYLFGLPIYCASHLFIRALYHFSFIIRWRFKLGKASGLPPSKCVKVIGIHSFPLVRF